MADAKLTALDALANPTSDDLLYVVDDAGGTPVSKKATLGSGLMSYGVCQGRLTLTTATPVTTADVTGTATLYYTPYVGDQIGLYNASGTWSVLAFTEKNLSLAGYTASKPYDIFAYDNAGTLALESLIWTDGTTRATALAYQNGILVKSGAATRRYLGTIYINSAGGQTEDTVTQRFVWNYYNRVQRRLYRTDVTSHNHTGGWRYWNNDSAQKVEYFCGLVDDLLFLSIYNVTILSSNATSAVYVALGVDINNNRTAATPYTSTTLLTTIRSGGAAHLYPSLGYHYIAIVEGTDVNQGTFYTYEFQGSIIG